MLNRRVFVNPSRKTSAAGTVGVKYASITHDGMTHFTWIYILKNESEAGKNFEHTLGHVERTVSAVRIYSLLMYPSTQIPPRTSGLR